MSTDDAAEPGSVGRLRRIDALFEAALELEPDEREEFLARSCGDDPELVEKVQRLLLASAHDAPFLEPGGALQGPLAEELLRGSSTDLSGRRLERYVVLGRLGAGGMGQVYLAEDLELKRKVALKVLPEELAGDARSLERFRQEAQTLAALNHPNIVTIHSVEEADGVRFLTMELVEGPRLDKIIPEGGLEIERLLDVALQLVRGLSAAHEHRVTHRDLKAANVMLTPDGRVKILDFGLAKLRRGHAPDAGESELATLTQTGEIVGTLAYMSPEQLQGRAVDERSDVFSLGVLLFEMTTGVRPFEGEDPASAISAILRDPPLDPLRLRRGLPVPLAEIILRCLEKDPADRFASAQGVERRLVELKARIESTDQPVVAGPARSGSPIGARPALWIGASLVLLVVTALVFWLPGQRPDGQGDGPPIQATSAEGTLIAVLPFENLGGPEDEYLAAGMTEEINSRLTALAGLDLLARRSVEKAATGDKTAQEICAELGCTYLLDGSVRWQREVGGKGRVRVTQELVRASDGIQVWGQTFDRSPEDLFAIQAEIAGRVAYELGIRLSKEARDALGRTGTDSLEAYEAYQKGRQQRGGASFPETAEATLPFFERAVELDPDFLAAWRRIVETHGLLYGFGFDKTEARLAKAQDALERMRQIDPASLETQLAEFRFYRGVLRDYGRAHKLIVEAARRFPKDPRIQWELAKSLRRQGRFEEASARFERLMRLDPLRASNAQEIGYGNMYLRRYPEAVRYLDRALAIEPDFSWAHQTKSKVLLLWRGDTQAARAALEPVAEMPRMLHDRFWLDVYEEEHASALALVESSGARWLGRPVHFRPPALLAGFAHQLLGQPEKARGAWEEARRQLEAELEKTPENEKMLSALALVYAGLGRGEDAIATARRAADLVPLSREPYFGLTHVEDLAWVYTLVGDLDAALDEIETLLSMPAELSVTLLELDPRWAPLRDHPRFRELKARYGTSTGA